MPSDNFGLRTKETKMKNWILSFCCLFSTLPAYAGKAEQTYPTLEGGEITVTRKGRAVTQLLLATGDKSSDIRCSSLVSSTSTVLPPVMLAQNFATAADRSEGEVQIGDVMPFGIPGALAESWYMAPRVCPIGISSSPGFVTVIVATFGKMNGRAFSVSADTAREMAAFIKVKP